MRVRGRVPKPDAARHDTACPSELPTRSGSHSLATPLTSLHLAGSSEASPDGNVAIVSAFLSAYAERATSRALAICARLQVWFVIPGLSAVLGMPLRQPVMRALQIRSLTLNCCRCAGGGRCGSGRRCRPGQGGRRP